MVKTKNIFKHSAIVILTAFGLSACSVDVTSDDHGLHRKDVKRIVCDMVDHEALEHPEDCPR